jgi:cell division ATPase FtsA
LEGNMAKQKSGEIIVGLDIGTTKICAIVASTSLESAPIPRRGFARAWW